MLRTLALLLIAVVAQPQSYRAEIETFRKNREAEIGGEGGWASLAGLHWLMAGTHTVGRDKSNDVVLEAPSAPQKLGIFVVTASNVSFAPAAGVDARVKGQPIQTTVLRPNTEIADGVTVGDMTFVVIKRGARLGLRVWDRQSPTRVNFHGLRWYPIDPAWRVDATFVPHQPAPKAKILNVLNETVEMTNPGTAVFRVGGQEYRLEAFLEEDAAKELFFIIKDATSGKTTYGAGRYLYTDLPKDGHVILDFNKAMNPPCAFTNFATCPLPPASNHLTLAIAAGELSGSLTRSGQVRTLRLRRLDDAHRGEPLPHQRHALEPRLNHA